MNQKEIPNFKKIIETISISSIILGFSVIIGWIFNLSVLKSILPGFVSMKFNTALSIFLLGLSLFFQTSEKEYLKFKISKIFSSVVLIIGILTLVEGIFKINLNIDEFFFNDYDPNFPENKVPGRMSQLSAISFTLIGNSFLLLNSKHYFLKYLSQIFLHITTLLSFIAIIGYLSNVPSFYKLSFLTSMAVHTSVAFFMISIAGSLVNHKIGIIGIYTGDKIGNKIARSLTVKLITIISIFTYIRLLTHHYEYISVEFGIILLALSFIISSIFIVSETAKNLNDIEEKKQEVEGSFIKVNSFLNATPDPIIIVDDSGLIQIVNKQFETIVGYSEEEIINQPLEKIIPGIYLKNLDSSKQSTDTKIILQTLKKDNTEISVEVSSSIVYVNNQLWTAVALRNISEQLILSERLKVATHNSLIGIWDYDVVNNILIWDDIMLKLYGIQKENFKGAYEAWREGLHPDDIENAELELQLALDGTKEFETEFRVVWPDKSIHYIKAKALVHKDASGKPIRMIGTNRDITTRVDFQNKIKESNRRNMIFIEQAPGAIAMFDKNMCYMAASQQWIKDYKLEGKELIGKSHYEIFPEIGDDWKKIHEDCLNGAINQCDESVFVRADGSKQWITWDVRPWYEKENEIGGIIMYTADITHIKLKDIEKRKIEEILDKTNEIAKIGTWEVNLKSNTIHWSRMTKEIHEVPEDYQPELNTAINFFKPGESRDKIQKAVAEGIEKGTPYDIEVELTTLKGNDIWARAIGQAEFENGKCSRLYGVFQDITKTKLDEKNLRIKNEELSAIFNNKSISIIVTDSYGKVTHFNKGAENLLQFTANEVIGKQKANIFHLENEMEDFRKKLSEKLGKEIKEFNLFKEIANNSSSASEWTYVKKDGSNTTVLLTITALKDEKGEILAYLETGIDITEKIENQKKLVEAKENLEILAEKLSSQNKQLASFAHITSHNLRSPVGNLNSLLHLYNETEDETEKLELFEKFEIVIKHLTTTLNSLIEAIIIRDKANNELETIDFESIFKKTKEIVTAQIMESGAEINSDFSEASTINYNKEYLESILLNLLTNSIKYKNPQTPLKIDVKTKIIDHKVVLTFKDNGLGINLKRHGEKLFGLNKTFHRHAEAKGIGLYLTKTQIDSMGGNISVESEVNIGTTFTIKF